MGQPGDVDYRFTVDSSGVISAAAAIEGALGQAATGATAAGDKMNTALGKAATAGAKATTAIGPLSGVLGKVSPAAGAAAAGIAGLSGSVRALGAALSLSGPVMAAMTVALVAVAGAYTLIAKEAKRAEEAEKAALAARETEASANLKFAEIVGRVAEEHAIATGAIDKATAAQMERSRAVLVAYRAEGNAIAALTDISESERKVRYDLAAADRDRALEQIRGIAAANAATAAGVAGAKAREDAEKNLAEREKAEEAGRKERREAYLRHLANRQKALDGLAEAFEDAAKAEADADEEAEAARVKRAEETTARLAAEDAKRIESQRAAGQATVGFFASVQEFITQQAADSTEAQKEELRQQWKLLRGVRAAEAGINAVAGFARAIADYAYPYSLVVGAAALGTGLVQVGLITGQEPPFHAGTADVRARSGRVDEINARLQVGEAVASRQGAERLGRENIERANAGRPAQPTEIRVVNQYRHQEFNVLMRDNLRQGGPTREAINKGTVTGHRTDRR